MLSVVVYGLIGLVMLVFAGVFERLVVVKARLHLTEFAVANALVGLALIVMAVVAYIDNITLLQVGVIAADALLFGAVVAMCDTIFVLSKYRDLWLIAAGILVVYALFTRVGTYPPSAFVSDGVLGMGSPFAISVTMWVLVAAVWVPVSILVARGVCHRIARRDLWEIIAGMYVAIAVAIAGLLSVHDVVSTIILGSAAVICGVVTTVAQVMVAHLAERRHKHLEAEAQA